MSPRAGLDAAVILQATVEIADTHGYEGVTLAMLAQKLGVRSPSLYNHVNGLPGLRSKLAVYAVKQLTEKLASAVADRTGDEAVRALADAYVAFARSHPGIYEATLRAPDPQDGDLEQAAGMLVDLVVHALRGYGLEEEAAIHTVRGLRSLLHGFVSLERVGGFGIPLKLDDSLHMLIETFLAGIHARTNK
jgi:AcrR family transcriptional regulator